jgi:hypothetical protein
MFFRQQVSFLGHVIDAYGIHTDPERVRQILSWPAPESITDVRIFLGLTSYYRKYVQDYAAIACPMYELTRKDAEFEWTSRRENAMSTLKRELAEHTQLVYPMADGGPFILDTDVSGEAIGPVLSQLQEGNEEVLAFGSRCLSVPERNYCVTRKNC